MLQYFWLHKHNLGSVAGGLSTTLKEDYTEFMRSHEEMPYTDNCTYKVPLAGNLRIGYIILVI